MSSPLERFLDERLPLPGIVACAIRLPDRSIISRRDGDALTTAQVEQAFSRLTVAAEGLKRHRFEVRTLCWTFDHARIHLTRRPDGSQLAVFSERAPDQPICESALHLVAAFHDLAES
ncbi:MAG: hypothetical protein RLY20_2101 [Verrucomicrobiota bacterium]|jgi:hypothetical protein